MRTFVCGHLRWYAVGTVEGMPWAFPCGILIPWRERKENAVSSTGRYFLRLSPRAPRVPASPLASHSRVLGPSRRWHAFGRRRRRVLGGTGFPRAFPFPTFPAAPREPLPRPQLPVRHQQGRVAVPLVTLSGRFVKRHIDRRPVSRHQPRREPANPPLPPPHAAPPPPRAPRGVSALLRRLAPAPLRPHLALAPPPLPRVPASTPIWAWKFCARILLLTGWGWRPLGRKEQNGNIPSLRHQRLRRRFRGREGPGCISREWVPYGFAGERLRRLHPPLGGSTATGRVYPCEVAGAAEPEGFWRRGS